MTTELGDDPMYVLAQSSLMWLMGLAKQRTSILRGAIRCRDLYRKERQRADDAERLCVELLDEVDTAELEASCWFAATLTDDDRAAVEAMRARMKGGGK